MSWQCLRCGEVDRHRPGCPDEGMPLISYVAGPPEKELVYVTKDELERLRNAEDELRRIRLALGNDYGDDPAEFIRHLRAVAEAVKRYLAVKKSWDNRLPELKALRQAIEEAERGE